nr:centrosomal protein of 97 kDa-like [Onthophagus taurus]
MSSVKRSESVKSDNYSTKINNFTFNRFKNIWRNEQMDNSDTLNLSGKKLKKLSKPQLHDSHITTLILDENELQRLDNIDSYTKVQKLSAVRNQLLRMHQVCRLQSLHTLNLANNGILTIEGLKDLIHLRVLNLAKNNIKTIEHLNTNVNLEHLDLSENSITHIVDLSFLKNLRELLLHNNKIGHLRQCDRFLPTSLITLTLASNNISDLNEISQLVNLKNLNSISIAGNPCVTMTGNKIGFDYRPFIINWCMNVQIIDGYVVDAIESLRGEWLYSQGRGRHFRVGDQDELSQYLASTCPLTGEQLETEEDRKLRLILSKAQHHQQQLREQSEVNSIPSPLTRKRLHGAKYSPKTASRIGNRNKSPDRMSSSCYSSSTITESSNLMTQSLDPKLLSETVNGKCNGITKEMSSSVVLEKCLDISENEMISSPLQALSKLVPVPESLMSPDYRPSPLIGRLSTPSSMPMLITNRPVTPKSVQSTATITKSPKSVRSNIARNRNLTPENKRVNTPSPNRQRKMTQNNEVTKNDVIKSSLKKSASSEDESEIYDSKLQSIQLKAEEKKLKVESGGNVVSGDDKIERAAVIIQRMWRGYYIRNCDKDIQDLYKSLQARRADEYIQKLASDMESTKAALESERKIQMLQMQAINALWKKVSTINPENESANNSVVPGTSKIDNVELVKDLAQTCSVLQNQIQQLQGSMQDIVKFMTMFSQMSNVNQQLKETVAGTQTEIIAVHTPQGDGGKLFPFQKQTRPSSLPLPIAMKSRKEVNQELKQFAGTLVDGVIKTVSETNPDCLVGHEADAGKDLKEEMVGDCVEVLEES